MISPLFKETVLELLPLMEFIVNKENTAPQDFRQYSTNISEMGRIVQYAYYTAIVRSFLKNKSAHIIDWGGQFGQVTKFVQHYYEHTECYLPEKEISVNPDIKYFNEILKIQLILYGLGPDDYSRINILDNYADAVISSGVLEHVCETASNEHKILREINRILKPGGYFFIWNLPPRRSMVEYLAKLTGKWYHKQKYDSNQIKDSLKNAGFKIQAFSKHSIIPGSIRCVIGKLIGYENAYIFDEYLSILPLINYIANTFTIVATKAI